MPTIGQQYDLIAAWWSDHHEMSEYGVAALERALGFVPAGGGKALDVGCGAGGRLMRPLQAHGFHVTGVDASAEMIAIARTAHPAADFIQADIINWTNSAPFDFILAWDCLFHLPLENQKPVLTKLCEMLSSGGFLIYSFGDAEGSHSDDWRGQRFSYSSLGVTRNLEVLHQADMHLRHLELDQFPDKHVYAIAQKL